MPKKQPHNYGMENAVKAFDIESEVICKTGFSSTGNSELVKTRSNTLWTLESPVDATDSGKNCADSLAKDAESDCHYTTQEDDKLSEPKMIGSNDDTPETGIVFNIRRLNKKTNKFVLLTKHRKIITKCSHTDGEYYAKGMCKKCYHNKGERSKYATKCGHPDKYHYARGLCKGCYLVEYHNKRKAKTS
jgi:hypothetical protein